MKKILYKEDREHFIETTKKPIFYLGIAVWIALFVFLFSSSFLTFRTGQAISSGSNFGVSNSLLFSFLFVVLSIILFLTWRCLIKRRCFAVGNEKN